MRVPIMIWVRDGDNKLVAASATLWVGEVPPECRRGRNRKMKSRQHKQERMEHLVEARRAFVEE